MDSIQQTPLNRIVHLELQNKRLRAAVWAISCFALFGILLTLALITNAQVQRESVLFGGQSFSVGMPTDEALSKLALCCKISGRDNSYFVGTKQTPFEILGGIWFSDRHVSMIKRDVGQFEAGGPVNLGQSVFRLLREISHNRTESVVLETVETEGSNVSLRTINLRFRNGRSAVLEIAKVDSNAAGLSDHVDISEVLQEP